MRYWQAARSALSRLLSFFYFSIFLSARARTQNWRYRADARKTLPRVRPYRPGDEHAIVRLFHLTFRKHKSLDRWRWEFLESPFEMPNIALLESDRAGIVGHYAGILARLQLDEEVIPAAQGVDLMIHPAFRSRAALEHLTRGYLQNSRDQGVKLFYGFNGRVVARSLRRILGVQLEPVSEWIGEITRLRDHMPCDPDRHILRVQTFDARTDALWDRIKSNLRCAIVRDSRYLNWRYSPRSDRDYTLWEAVERSTGSVVGIAVLGAHQSDGLIFELLTAPGDERTMSALLRASIEHLAETGNRRVRAWLPEYGKLRECAQAVGLTATEQDLFLDVFGPDDSIDSAGYKNFYYTLGDYDVY